MKRKSLKTLVCMTILSIGLALTACGGKEEKDSPVSGTEQTAEDKEESTEEGKQEEAGAGTLEDYFSTAEGKLAYEVMVDTTKATADGMDVEMEVSGNKFTCTFKIAEVTLADYTEDQVTAIKDAMKEQYASSAADCQEIAASLEEQSGVKGVIYEMAFVDNNGELIYSEEFTAQ